MDRSDAATTLFLWHLKGDQDLLRAAGQDGDRTLLSIVEAVAPPASPASEGPPRRPLPGFLRLEEEREVASLRERVKSLLPVLTPEEREVLEANLRSDLVPRSRLERLRADLDRFRGRELRRSIQADFEAHFVRPAEPAPEPAKPPAPPAPNPLRALLLFSRTGKLVAVEGDPALLDLEALSQLVARGDPGNTWSLAHRTGSVVGHLGERTALVAVFARRPRASVGGTLRVSVQSLEQRARLMAALNQPGSHGALTAYLRAVRVLLNKSA